MLTKKLNGFQRIWVVVSGISFIPALILMMLSLSDFRWVNGTEILLQMLGVFVSWLIFIGFLYVLGLAVAWIIKGFKE